MCLGVVLGCSYGLCWRSWAALGVYVGGFGPLLGPKLAVLGRSWGLRRRSWDGITAKSGPNPEKWPKPERELGPKGGREPEAAGPGTYFFCRYTF